MDKNRIKFDEWLKENEVIESCLDSIIAKSNLKKEDRKFIIDIIYCGFQAGMLEQSRETGKMLDKALLKI